MKPPSPITRWSHQRMSLRGRWRSWVAWCALIALVWPSLGPLPWIAVELVPHHRDVAHESAAAGASERSGVHHHGDASDIPGSPTHPIDHDCLQCQVLTHLARCIVPALDLPTIPAAAGCAVQPHELAPSHRARLVAVLPQARAPPLRST